MSSEKKSGTGKVDAESVVAAKVARGLAKEAFADGESPSAEAICDCLTANEANLSTIDPTWAIEVNFFAGLAENAGATRLQQMIVGCSPVEGDFAGTAQQSASKIVSVLSTKLAKFCSPAVQSWAKACLELVHSIAVCQAPALTKTRGPMIRALIARLANLLVHTVGKTKLQGRQALGALFSASRKKGILADGNGF